MPRDSYYQDVGNPIQKDRLPERAISMCLPFWGDATIDVEKTLFKTMAILCLVDFVGCLFVSFGGFLELRGIFDHFMFLIGAILCGCTMLRRQWWMLPIWIVAFIGLVASFFVSSNGPMQLLVGGLALAGFSFRFAEHWIESCTADPMDKTLARRLRRAWYGNLGFVAIVPIGASIVAVYLTIHSGFFLILLVFGLAQIVLVIREKQLVLGPIKAINSWFSYNSKDAQIPGIFKSPSGNLLSRRMISLGTLCLIEPCIRAAYDSPLLACGTLVFVPVLMTLPILVEASHHQNKEVDASNWKSLTSNMRSSPNPIERQSYFVARVVKDGSPLLVPRPVYGEHAHFLGGSGSGKTSLGLSPWIEQTIGFGDCSIIVVDLKADTLELLATLMSAADELRRQRGIELPLKLFSNQDDLQTHGFNPIKQPSWTQFNPYIRTDILCGATGLEYGSDYGAGFYSSANASVLHHIIKSYPGIENFRDLANRCGYVLHNADNTELHPDIRRAGVHVHEILKRLAAFDALNVSSKSCKQIVDHSIDLSDVFRKPQLHYFHLSATLSPGASPALARLVTYFLLASAAKAKRDVPVYLVIDEFQRMVAQNTEYMLQLARSMGVGVILANQSMEDLRTLKANLIPAIEANCRFRQWFDVPSSEDRKRVAETGGECVELKASISENSDGKISTTASETVMPRLSTNDILLASDHPKRSIVRLSRGAGYAQFGGLPIVVESDYHISEVEFSRRKAIAWPKNLPGTFVAKAEKQAMHQRDQGPVVTTEVIDRKRDLFADLLPRDAGNTDTTDQKRQ